MPAKRSAVSRQRINRTARRDDSFGASLLYGTLDVPSLLSAQGVPPIRRIEDLAEDVWPEDDDVTEFVELIYRWRREDN